MKSNFFYTLEVIGCRIYQAVFKIGDYVVPYRLPEYIDGPGSILRLPDFLRKKKADDLLIVTADHGNDPTFIGNDHTRENVPVIIYSRNFKNPTRLEPFETFANIGATIADNFDLEKTEIGESILDKLD